VSDRQPSPQLGGATEALVHERASATPSSHAHHTRNDRLREDGAAYAAPALPESASLRALQEWFVEAVTSPCDDERLTAGARSVLTRGPALEELERLAIYRYAYRSRLVECLADDYPALQFALGPEPFEALCHEYIRRHPSSSPNLNFFGRSMADFCRVEAQGPFPLRAFSADLAKLEWALVEVLHARDSEALSPAALEAIPIDGWPSARLPPSAAVRLLRFEHPVNAFFQSFKTDGEPDVPGPSPAATVVYRTEMTLWRMDLTPAMATLLEGLFRGETLGEALGKLAEGLREDEAEEAERNVMVWFREWVRGGLFARVELADGR
jgi:hypothetical protein